MLRASLGKVVHTVKRAGTYAAKVSPPELHKIAVHVRAVCTGHFLADAGEREVNLLETWSIKPFA